MRVWTWSTGVICAGRRFAVVPMLPAVAVLASALTVIALWVRPQAGQSGAQVVAAAATLDLTVAFPVLVWAGLWRMGRPKWIVLLPAFIAAFALARAMLPPVHRGSLDALRYAIAPAEAAAVLWLLYRARRALASAGGGDFHTRLRRAADSMLGRGVPADLVTTEVSILYHALRPPSRAHSPGFTMHRESGYPTVALGLGMAVLVETLPVHLMVGMWSPAAAWVLTGVSAYALLWLAGDARAVTSRLTEITDTHIVIRLGIRWEASVPHSRVSRVERIAPGDPACAVSIALLGPPNVRLTLEEDAEFTGMYGLRRRGRTVGLGIDRPAEFMDAVLRAAPHAAV